MHVSHPLQTPDTHLTIGPLAARFGVSPETLRVWEQKDLMPPARRTAGGHRRYGSEHVDALEQMLGPAAVLVG